MELAGSSLEAALLPSSVWGAGGATRTTFNFRPTRPAQLTLVVADAESYGPTINAMRRFRVAESTRVQAVGVGEKKGNER